MRTGSPGASDTEGKGGLKNEVDDKPESARPAGGRAKLKDPGALEEEWTFVASDSS
jgi:hypothetical protein